MESDLEVVGPVTAVLYVSTSAPDTDFTAKLVDVFPDGNARNLSDGILRMRYREGLDRAELVNPGHVYRIAVDAGVTANLFRKGHRIRLEVSSSNFPRFDRNPNTGGRISEEARSVAANQTVYHDRERLSQLEVMAIETRPAQQRVTGSRFR
jgi:putative CocE/NonD family hydrolase